MMRRCLLFVLVVQAAVVGAGEEQVSKKEGETVTLPTGVQKQRHEEMLWCFNDIRIAMINGDANDSCLYHGEGGIFKDSLKVDYESGSLTIKNIRPEHAGRYEADYRNGSSGKSQKFSSTVKSTNCNNTAIIKSHPDNIIKTFNVTVIDSGLSACPIAGICVFAAAAVVVAAAAVVLWVRPNMYSLHNKTNVEAHRTTNSFCKSKWKMAKPL